MTDEMKFAIEVGMRVMVKVAAREIPATVIEVREDCFIVKSETTGREFRTSRVVDILDQPETAEPAEAPAAEEAETSGTAEETDNAGIDGGEAAVNPPPREMPEEPAPSAEAEKPAAVSEAHAAEAAGDKAETTPAEESAAGSAGESDAAPCTETGAENAAQPAGETEAEAAPAEKPKKNLSLVDAAVEVLKAEKRPMNVKEMVKLAVERGLWIPTKCRTPEQSLYGGLYLDMKNSPAPRVKKSSEKGKFELA
jgi:hypothetical protein